MEFTNPIEILALILIAVVTIKMFVLVVKPIAWMDFTKWIYKRPPVTRVVFAILGGLIFYYLIKSGMGIVQILAVSLFMAMLFGVGLSEDIKPFIKKYEGQIKAGRMWQKHWFYTLIWIALLVWGALVLFNVV